MPRLTIEYREHIAFVTLTRGDKMNALDPEMVDAILAAGAELAETKARAVVLSGEGKAFCAGLDVMSFAAMAQGNLSERIAEAERGEVSNKTFSQITEEALQKLGKV